MTISDRITAPNYYRLRTEERLWCAWNAVKSSGLASTSPRTRSEIKAFEARARTLIRRIASQLRSKVFSFGVAKGILIPRPNKSPRPIVIVDVSARVVQRALLDELQDIAALRPLIDNPHSFGGVQKRSRGDAIREALRTIDEGAGYFLRSDIRDFFTQIPRERALERILPFVDAPTGELLQSAMRVELANASDLGHLRRYFPDEERGVAQGFCLSSLFGNTVLAEFDAQMNGRGIRCLRYVDDFLLLGETERSVRRAFESAIKHLELLGLSAYDPCTSPEKAKFGRTDRAFDFLGCAVQRGLVGPSRKAKRDLLKRVDGCVAEAARYFAAPSEKSAGHGCLARTLYDINNIVHGWRRSFDFCHQESVFIDIDRSVDERVQKLLRSFGRSYSQGDATRRRAILGISSMVSRPSSSGTKSGPPLVTATRAGAEATI